MIFEPVSNKSRYRIPDGLSSFLDASRWVAALLVVMSHVKYLLFVDFAKVQHPSWGLKGLYFFGGFGHEAVIIFFVLSGFLVGGLTWDKWSTSGVDLKDYVIHRFARLYTVLVPALCLGFALDTVGLNWFNASELYTHSAKYHTISMNIVFADGLDLNTILGNLLMLEGVTVTPLGSNTPLWSLASEFWYYGLFAAIAVLPFWRGGARWAAVTAAVAMVALLPADITAWGLNWLIGVAAFAVCKRLDRRLPRWMGLLLLLGTLAWLRLAHNIDNSAHGETFFSNLMRDVGLAVVYAAAIVFMSGPRPSWPLERFHRWAAGFSFTLYLVHFPMMIFIAAVATDVCGFQIVQEPDASNLLMYFGMIGSICAYAVVLAHLTERHTARIRGWLMRLVATPLKAT